MSAVTGRIIYEQYDTDACRAMRFDEIIRSLHRIGTAKARRESKMPRNDFIKEWSHSGKARPKWDRLGASMTIGEMK